MSVLPQQWHPLRRPYHTHTCRYLGPPCIRAAITTTTPQRDLSLIEPHVPTSPTLATTTPRTHSASEPSLRSTWAHRAWVMTGCTSVLVSLAKSTVAATGSGMWLEPLLAGLLGYVLADFGTGVYHWAIDNYGDASTPVFGSQIEAFQGHHKWPRTIARRQFANNLHSLARATAFVLVPIDLLPSDGIVHTFVAVCSGCIMFSQQFHAWAHSTKSQLPPLVLTLQDAGVLVSRAKHVAHHRSPYNNNYCIVSGVWNEFLDDRRFFEAMEMIVFFKFGVRPRSWSEPNSNWAEDGDATSAQTVHV
ncbi:fatty acid desaturase 4, chloroplastic-like [Magnolia sinica]|uniref:fatty acid desaturase 4, chloroplastic-like n=1 Tax=Magnolia sinica TaxID=86752 RepID=UPI00265838F6|nr:fatty acid desaturase 4, chloroplastic-like [Magnolia sinica]